MSGSAFAVTHHAFSSGAGRTSDGNGSHASTLKSPSYTKSVSWQHYPIASSIINSGGNLGGFVAPMAAGFLLDKTGSFNSVFTYFGICAAIGLVVILFLDEPQ